MNQLIDPKGEILVMELGSRQLSEALQAFAYETLRDQLAESVKYVATYFDRLLPYRNYYVHGAVGLGSSTSEPFEAGIISAISAKGKLMEDKEWLTASQLDQFHAWAGTLTQYATAVTFHMFFPIEPRLPLPEKPPLPPQLAKRRLSLRQLKYPDQA